MSSSFRVLIASVAPPLLLIPRSSMSSSLRVLIFRLKPFWIQLHYFITLSLVGFLALKVSRPRTASFRPKDMDIFFTSVSASTVSSMSTVEMEVFSNTQLIFLTILMLAGGEVFTSLLGLQLMRSKFSKNETIQDKIDSLDIESDSSKSKTCSDHQIELGLVSHLQLDEGTDQKTNSRSVENGIISLGYNENLRYNSIKWLAFVVLCYLLVVHIAGSTLISLYIILVPSARKVLKDKDLQILTFSVFTIVSTFTNCGFLPTNENAMAFKKNSGLLLLLIPHILLGNTLYPSCLRFVIWVLEKITKREEFSFLLKNSSKLGYSHLLPSMHSCCLAVTVFGFVFLQFILFCYMEWNSDAMDGLNSYQKLVGSLFQVVNSRHSGESVVDLSIISPAILVLFVVMMYFPPYTSFLPIGDHKEESRDEKRSTKKRRGILENLLFSQLSYLVIFVIIICITEREKMKEDPLNFNVLNVTIEVISAYGNVGFSTGYSCERKIKPDSRCKDASYGFAGRWSSQGKLILILVMFFGRLKKFHLEGGGRAWKLS